MTGMVEFTLDGRTVSAAEGELLVHAAARHGTFIPTLCHDSKLDPYGGCRMCVVDVEGAPRPMPACATKVAEGKRAVTEIALLERLHGASLLRCSLETGRTHQIRVHLAELGHPVLADALYGRVSKDPKLRAAEQAIGRQALHAQLLGFTHPLSGERLRFTADPPADFARALSELARVQEYAGRMEESLHTCQEAVEWARHAEDTRLQAALHLRLADTLEHLGDPAAARLHRGAAKRMLGEEPLDGEPELEETPVEG